MKIKDLFTPSVVEGPKIEAGKILGIVVVDHIIVARNGFISFKEKGLIS